MLAAIALFGLALTVVLRPYVDLQAFIIGTVIHMVEFTVFGSAWYTTVYADRQQEGAVIMIVSNIAGMVVSVTTSLSSGFAAITGGADAISMAVSGSGVAQLVGGLVNHVQEFKRDEFFSMAGDAAVSNDDADGGDGDSDDDNGSGAMASVTAPMLGLAVLASAPAGSTITPHQRPETPTCARVLCQSHMFPCAI